MDKRIKKKRMFGIIGSGVLIVIVLGGLFWLVRGTGTPSTPRQHPASVVTSSPTATTVQLDAATRTEVAEQFAQVLANDYAYPALGAKMAATIRARLAAHAYDGITSPQAFAGALQADARAVSNDRHLQIEFQPPSSHRQPVSPRTSTQGQQQNVAIPEVEILDGNIGYLVVNEMQPLQVEQPAIAAAFAFLQNTNALIIDLRGNPGGTGNDAGLIEGYLSEGAPYVTDTIHWRVGNRVQEAKTADVGKLSYGTSKPVFVLTSPVTFSAAEGLAYDLQAFKRATIVGQTTGGGANPTDIGSVSLGHGFFVNMPDGYVVNAITGTNWEGVGVKPNVAVPADQALTTAWSLAVKSPKTSATTQGTQAWLQAFSLAKLSGAPSLTAAQLVGQYIPKQGGNPGAPVTILEKNGKLFAQVLYAAGAENVALIPLGGDRYQPDGFPSGFSLTFVRQNGTIELLQVQQSNAAPWTILEKS